MDRVDSGFEASSYKTATNTDSTPVSVIMAAPIRPSNPRKTISDSPSNHQSMNVSKTRSSFEKRPSAQRRLITEPRRPSIGSSSENSTTKSRSRGYGSKSSRHTSCTLVDPSRPTRHYRIKSSQSIPSANRGDIDDVLALHFRSCSLFENPTYYSPLPSPVHSGHEGAGSDIGSRQGNSGSSTPHQERTDYIGYDITSNINNNKILIDSKQSEETIAPPERANTTMHWMSPSTRKRQYEKIDKANSGLRGFVNRICPRCVSGPPPPKFYEKDKSDAGSVRRYRISDEEEEDEDEQEGEYGEKNISIIRPHQAGRPEISRSPSTPMKSARWGCF